MDLFKKVQQSLKDVMKGVQENYRPFMLKDETSLPEKVPANIVKINQKGQDFQSPTTIGAEEMNNIRQRSDGRWEGRKTIDGKRYSVYARTKKECKAKLKEFKPGIKPKPQKNTTISFIDFAKKWLELYKSKNIKPTTYNMYDNAINKHLDTLTKPINTYTTEDLQIFLNNMPETRTKEITFLTLVQVYKKAIQLKVIKENPAMYLEKGIIQKKEVTCYTLDEQKKILSNIHKYKIGKYILAYLLTGARLNELRTIRKDKIKNGYLYINGTKTKNSKRWIKISPAYEQLLSKEEDPIFTMTEDKIQKRFNEYMEKLELKGTIHKLRHTFNTNLYYLGATDMERKEFMGHASITTTNNIYTHLDRTVSKKDIINLYRDLYPNFDPNFDPKNQPKNEL